MGRLYISPENQVDGPWLMGHENLETLNNLFNEIDVNLEEALVKTIENTAKQQMEDDNQSLDYQKRIAKLQRKYNNKLKSVEITFSNGNAYRAENIESIINYVAGNSTLSPTELNLRIINGNYENEFNLIINSNAGKEEDEFEYKIRCIDEEIQLKIKSLIDKWIRENKPSRILNIWSNYLVYFVWIVGFLTILFTIPNHYDTSKKTESYKNEHQKETRKIIEKEVNQTNIDSAILLILKLQSNYIPDKIKAGAIEVRNKEATKVLVVSLIVFIISLVRPKTIIGIGKKYNKLQLYKFWIRFTYSSIVALVGTLLIDSFFGFISW